ncbi:MAG: sirohydrochlorin chelatase [Cyanobacteria bacterium SID2]|nr:sirohydrochlorin chelatase [Cyanobacteria bacterium SID2]MBP0004448.1 sirohydrochlorin chelatase [Cyanobacteria bacterium SBC]
MSRAYLLVSHGSRDPRPLVEMKRLAQWVAERIPEAAVGTAVLECHPQPLHRQLLSFVDRLPDFQGVLSIVPLFLLPGVHVKEDIPEELALARSQLPEAVSATVLPYLGSSPQIVNFLAGRAADFPSVRAWVMVSHGSRRPGGNAPVESLAERLQQHLDRPVRAAYWAVEPNLEHQIVQLIESGVQSIAILPYFLCCGGLTDAIGERVKHLADRFPTVQFALADPIGASPELADLVVRVSQCDMLALNRGL